MSPDTALLLFAAGVAGLFYLDREPNANITKALWLPTAWLLLNGSRPVSLWLGAGPTNPTPKQIMEGNPLDAAVYGLLLLTALIVVWRRREQVKPVLRLVWPVMLYFAYCGMSTLWSAYTEVSLKRWVKSWGDLAMVLVVATEPDISAALRRMFSRAGFVALPASVLTIKYFPAVGRYFSRWTGQGYDQGVSITKNGLGGVTFVIGAAAVWQLFALLRAGTKPGRGRRLAAQAALAGTAAWLLSVAHSATSDVAFTVAAATLALTTVAAVRHPAAVNALMIGALAAGLLALSLGAERDVTHDLGRRSNLTDRTIIWAAVLAQAGEHPLLGTGFESFWLGQNLRRVWDRLPAGLDVNESHDGYLEVYAQLGLLGVAILALLLITAYRRSLAALRGTVEAAPLPLAYVASVAVYNIAEAGFRLLDTAWFALLLAAIVAAQVSASSTARRKMDGERATAGALLA